MTCFAIIPARGGSKRIQRKNIRLFHGKPIIAYSIEAAKACGLFDEIYVSTEDDEIKDVALRHGASIVHRPVRFTEDDIGTQDVTAAALKQLYGDRRAVDYACCIYATAPLMAPEHLLSGFERLGMRDNRYVYSVGPDEVDAGQWYWGTALAFTGGVPLEGNSIRYVIPAERVCDINTEEDWRRAEEMYSGLRPVVAGDASSIPPMRRTDVLPGSNLQ